ncbi:MAG: hypothetical protein ABF633_03145 [Clostridium sp.]|uniref:hypothetical protein n=1 Tax=Clostridium sp. TaxID=1506 RepID=UPI0039ED170D
MIQNSFLDKINNERNICEEILVAGKGGLDIGEATGLIQYFMEMKLPFKVCPHIEDTVSIELLN